MSTPDKCPNCGAAYQSCGFFGCDTCVDDDEPSPLCRERAARQKAEALAEERATQQDSAWAECVSWKSKNSASLARVRALEAELAKERAAYEELICAVIDNCKGCRGAGQDNDGEGYINEPCPDCAWVGRFFSKDNTRNENQKRKAGI